MQGRLVGWLVFNHTFSTTRLYHAMLVKAIYLEKKLQIYCLEV